MKRDFVIKGRESIFLKNFDFLMQCNISVNLEKLRLINITC